MFQHTPSGIKFKIFVKKTCDANPSKRDDDVKNCTPVTSLSGDEAKEFYENILKGSSLSSKQKKPLMIAKPKSKLSLCQVHHKKFKETDLLHLAQNNDIKNLKLFFRQEQNWDVNIVDDFGWTPLMCASCSGATEAVKILLENQADPHRCDRLGNTALKLASQNNFIDIKKILENYRNEPESIKKEGMSVECEEVFFCPVCKENVKISKNKHESSTLHLFNCQLKTTTFYGIPESNKGFQLLLKEGWDKEKGLGPEGTGRKFPVKAVMKKDRAGIGAPPMTNSTKEKTEQSEKFDCKRKRIYRKSKERNFERNFRLEFS